MNHDDGSFQLSLKLLHFIGFNSVSPNLGTSLVFLWSAAFFIIFYFLVFLFEALTCILFFKIYYWSSWRALGAYYYDSSIFSFDYSSINIFSKIDRWFALELSCFFLDYFGRLLIFFTSVLGLNVLLSSIDSLFWNLFVLNKSVDGCLLLGLVFVLAVGFLLFEFDEGFPY